MINIDNTSRKNIKELGPRIFQEIEDRGGVLKKELYEIWPRKMHTIGCVLDVLESTGAIEKVKNVDGETTQAYVFVKTPDSDSIMEEICNG